MAYAAQNDIIEIYGERLLAIVGDRNRDGVVDEDAVETALGAASSEVDSYLATRYPVPIGNPPRMVVQACVDIAIYRLAYNTSALTEEMRLRYTDTISWLKLVAKGDAQLPDVPNSGPGDDDEDGGLQEITGGKRAGFFFSVRG